MAAKPADLGPSCVLFETFGKCPYGITCRFAKAHLGDGYQNVVNTELAKQWEGKSLVRNNLSKDLQHQLRKKKFTFKKADEYLCSLAKPHHEDRKGGKAPGCSAEAEEVSNCMTPEDGLGDPSHCPVLPEGGDSKPAPVQSPQPTESRGGCPTKTAGPVTDEDIVKLRSCEKKKVSSESLVKGCCLCPRGRQKRPLSWVTGREGAELHGDHVTVMRGEGCRRVSCWKPVVLLKEWELRGASAFCT